MKNLIYRWSGFDRVIRVIDETKDQDTLAFLRAIKEEFHIEYSLSGSKKSEYRSSIFVSNHHTGALDFLATYPQLVKVAPNLKVVVNKELLKIKPLKDIFIGVNPISSGLQNGEARTLIREHLKQGGNILIYPAGKVARKTIGKVIDYPWKKGLVHIIKDETFSIIPIYVRGENGQFFYLMRKLFPKLSLLFILRELKNKKLKKAHVILGEAINSQSINSHEFMNILRDKVYELEKSENLT